ncbi:MAG: cobalamin biosynthesis protein CobG, partial [Roseicyclus sp.]
MSASVPQEPQIKGWCPGAHRPMMSGDGLVVRVRPRLARLTAEQTLGLCALADRHGNGFLDLTNRANLQVRGVSEADHDALLQALSRLDLLDADPALESRRNVLVSPFWRERDLTERLTRAVLASLHRLPALPAKIGIAIDTGAAPVLGDASADFRFEQGQDGLILRADGASHGRPVTERTAIAALLELAAWFDARRSKDRRRMASVLARTALPAEWTTAAPREGVGRPCPGPTDQGMLLGAAFGQIDAGALARLMHRTGAKAFRVSPWRLFLLEGVHGAESDDFVTAPGDPLLA